jgi:hypothetical protein
LPDRVSGLAVGSTLPSARLLTAKPRKRCDEIASPRVISTGVFVALEASPFQVIRDLGKLGEGGLKVLADDMDGKLRIN